MERGKEGVSERKGDGFLNKGGERIGGGGSFVKKEEERRKEKKKKMI